MRCILNVLSPATHLRPMIGTFHKTAGSFPPRGSCTCNQCPCTELQAAHNDCTAAAMRCTASVCRHCVPAAAIASCLQRGFLNVLSPATHLRRTIGTSHAT